MAEVGTVYVSVMPTTKGFSKALGGAGGSGGTVAGNAFKASFGKIVGGSALGNILSNAFGKVTGAISSSLGAAVSRVDTIANFPKVMQNLGYGAGEADAAIKRLSDGIDSMPTSLDGIVSMTQQLAPMCGGLDNATSLSLAMNNMMLASSASTADQTRAMQQYTQMLARGKVELNDWRTLQEVMPGQLNQVAQAMLGAGKNSNDLYEALKAGKVTMTDFNAAVERLNTEGVDGFASFEQQARSATEGIGTAMENVRNRVAKAVGSVLNHIGQGNISSAINGFSSQFGNMATLVCQFWDGMVSKIDFAGFKAVFDELASAVGGLFSQGGTAATFGEQVGTMVNLLIPVIHNVTPFVQMFALAFKLAAENASWLVPALLVAVAAIKGIGIAKSVAPGLTSLAGGLTAAKAPAAGSAAELMKVGVACIALAAAVVLVCAGIWVLSQAAIQLAAAGPEAGLAMAGLVVAIGALVAAFALAAPALDAGALGMLAFGAAILLVGAGVMLACAGITLLSMALPTLSEYGLGAAAGITALGAAMLMAAPGAILLGVGLLLAGAGALVAGAGLAVLGAAALAAFLGLMLCAAPSATLGPALLQGGVGALMMAAALVAIAAASLAALPGLLALSAGIGGVALALSLATPAFLGLSGALGGCAGALSSCASSMMVIVVAGLLMGAAGASAASGLASVAPASSMAASGLQAACKRMESATQSLLFKVQANVSRIKAQFSGMRLHIPSPTLGPMPHFSLSGRFDLQAGTVPSINVNWYAKGGIFSHPSVIGVGEAGTEVVAPVDKLMSYIEGATARGGAGSSEELEAIYAVLVQILQAIPNWSRRDAVRFVKGAVNA